MVRLKRRYIVFQIDWKEKPTSFNNYMIQKRIQEEIGKRFGDFGAGLCQGNILGLNDIYCFLLTHFFN